MNMCTSLAAFVTLIAAANASGPVELTKDNFDGLTSGKNAFVKFLAPWCGHCKRMKPDWDKLGEEYAGSNSVVIGDADCTASGKELCEESEVSGYPTIKYFLNGEANAYNGGRDFDSLKNFVDETLDRKCNVEDESNCDEREVKYIAKMKAKSAEDVQKQVDRLEKMKGKSMKKDLKAWLFKRLNIVTQLSEAPQ